MGKKVFSRCCYNGICLVAAYVYLIDWTQLSAIVGKIIFEELTPDLFDRFYEKNTSHTNFRKLN